MRADDLSVGEVARRCGVPVSTLHFYEARGLIRSGRNAGNQRRYGRAVLRRIAIIRVAQRAGLSLSEIKAALARVPDGRAASVQDWRRMSTSWREGLQEPIDDLTRLRDQLDRCIGCGCLSLADCPLRNPQDVLGAVRSGPVLLD